MIEDLTSDWTVPRVAELQVGDPVFFASLVVGGYDML